MSESTGLFRDYLERVIIRADEVRRDTTSMGADTMQTWVRNQGELEASDYSNELINLGSSERWHLPGTRDDLLGTYIELTLARTAEITRLALEAEVDDRRKHAREYDEHEDLEYEEYLVAKITKTTEPSARG